MAAACWRDFFQTLSLGAIAMAEQPARPAKFLNQIRTITRLRRLSYQTEKAYLDWIKRFILFHQKRHPGDLGAPETEAYLTQLVIERKVAPSTQNQALHNSTASFSNPTIDPAAAACLISPSPPCYGARASFD
jgi:hypothetical protein